MTDTARQVVTAARTLLFVPGNRPERFMKAAKSGADGVILDLEDAVAPDAKQAARDHVRRWLLAHPEATVRINARGSAGFDDDIAVVAGSGCCVMLPKTESLDDLEALTSRLGPAQPVLALIETARGAQAAAQISDDPRVCRTALGTIDLAADLGVDPLEREALLLARTQLVLAARAAGLPGPFDGVTVAVANAGQLSDDVEYAASLGMHGKLCVHPRQIPSAHAAMSPSTAAVDWANRVLVAGAAGGVSLVDGEMVDAPVLFRARALLARAHVNIIETEERRHARAER